MKRQLIQLICAATALAACTEEPPPRSVHEFVENPILLEAAMVRCSQDRNSTRYDAECINAREAVKRIEAKEEAARRVELEKQSEAKRRALRRTQEAAAAARRRAADEAERRREEEYLSQFGVQPPAEDGPDDQVLSGNTPMAVIPEPQDDLQNSSAGSDYDDSGVRVDEQPSSSPPNGEPTGNTPTEQEPPGDLSAIREELKRRGENDDEDDGS